jgi:hypothetical protein
MENNQRLLNWLDSEKAKDTKSLDKEKEKLIKQIKGLKKEDLFPKEEKISIWKKIKIILLGK